MTPQLALHSKTDPLPIWPNLGQPMPGTLTYCAVLEQGTQSAGPALAFNIETQRGNVFVELSADDFRLIHFSLKGAIEQWESADKGKTNSSAATEPVQVDEPLPEIPADPPKPRPPRPRRPNRTQPPAPQLPEAA